MTVVWMILDTLAALLLVGWGISLAITWIRR